ncbi:MAG: hypothetical protein M3680_16180 [Myxococcota bacterium]|nr:hypothetical protein [Myxococcota bacterium]
MQRPLTIRPAAAIARHQEQRGAIGIAFLVWLFGGGLGIAIFVFVLLKVC